MIKCAGTGPAWLWPIIDQTHITLIATIIAPWPCLVGLTAKNKCLLIVICFENSPDNVDSEM